MFNLVESLEPEEFMKEDDLLFALDIGTRSVTGVVGRVYGDVLEVLRIEVVQYSNRAVVDGQIEDIEQTAKAAGEVKARLEKDLGVVFHEVHVAAAGRVLKTERTFFEMDVDVQRPIEGKDLMALEAAATQSAYENLMAKIQQESSTEFCNVGHTVVEFWLDGYVYSTLLGHRGKRAGVDMITTFLPSEVSESLYATMSLLGLSIASMTLEPIAAMNVVVPKELRLLNIAMVDVGAGTSDIAVADKGGICGYTMATMAGDEVTEQIMQEFLVDFESAERMKFEAGAQDSVIAYEDILGMSKEVSVQELKERIQPTVEELAKQIAQGIQTVNGKSPKAVFMVGGGSRTPGLLPLVARELSIENTHIAIGGSNYMKRQIQADAQYLNAEFATPIGIAVTAMGVKGNEKLTVSVNGVKIQLSHNPMTVMDALRRGGYQYTQIMGRSGKSIVFEYNGERKIVRGGLHTLAEIQVNGVLAGLSATLQPGDEIIFKPASDGKDAVVRLRDIAEHWNSFEVTLLGEKVLIGSVGTVNGTGVDGDYLIASMDKVEVQNVNTVGALLNFAEINADGFGVILNGIPCSNPTQELKASDKIDLIMPEDLGRKGNEEEQVQDRNQENGNSRLCIWLNGEKLELPAVDNGEQYQFFRLFNYVAIDPNAPQGEIVLLRNNKPASYLETIQDGDQLEIRWSQDKKIGL